MFQITVWSIPVDLGDGSAAVKLFQNKAQGLAYIDAHNEVAVDVLLENSDLSSHCLTFETMGEAPTLVSIY